ncbi:hypothetical protein FisN_23Hu252 [Fistulifera solaris]|uniref:Uncharacterized protein n=1 Tax=Fistulifera solaris TaxID=1519565 RepID=A0A1Z5JX24_FISSO|nr:hypothetical protein FisN_23Hu252 [Fistulifera solaris]|eukprot:GAX18358.1 hypothetical protein FisN_23Hu252 [Fistulifera solaris]
MNDSFVTTVSAESMSVEDVTKYGKGGAHSLSDILKNGLSDSSLDLFASSFSDIRNEGGPKGLMPHREQCTAKKHSSKEANGSLSELFDSSDSWDLEEFRLSSLFTPKQNDSPRKSRRRTARVRPHPPLDMVKNGASPPSPSKKSLGSYLEKSREVTSKPKVKGDERAAKGARCSYLVKMHLDGTESKPVKNDAPPRGARRQPSVTSQFMDSWQSKSSDSCNSSRKNLLYPYLQAESSKGSNHCDASVVSEVSGLTWCSGTSSLTMSEDDSTFPTFDGKTPLGKETCIHHSIDESLQGSFNFIEDATPKRPARRRTPSPSRRQTK